MENKTHILTLVNKLMTKTLNLKLVIMLEYQNIKTYLKKVMFEIGQKKHFVIKNVKNTVPWTYGLNDLKGEEIVETFCESELQKTNQNMFRIENVIKSKVDKVYVKWKGCNNSFNSQIDNKRHSINQ